MVGDHEKDRCMLIVSYWGPRESIAGATYALERLGWTVHDWPYHLRITEMFAPEDRDAPDSTRIIEDLCEKIAQVGASVVLAWANSITAQQWQQIHKRFPHLIVCLFNWDDPWWWCVSAEEAPARAASFDIVFTTCFTSVGWYLYHGTKQAHFVVPGYDPVDFSTESTQNSRATDDGKRDNHPLEHYQCDVAFAFTQYYDNSPHQLLMREKLVGLLCDADDIDFRFYGPEHIKRGRDKHYFGPLQYYDTAKLFANAKINICLHAIANVAGYVNERAILIPAVGGLLLIDDVPGMADNVVSADRGECVLLNTADPVGQIRELLREQATNSERLDMIRKNGHDRIRENFTWDHWARRVHDAIREYRKEDGAVSSKQSGLLEPVIPKLD